MLRNYYILGGALALTGIVMVRIISRFYLTGTPATMVYGLGILLATVGLLCIALGFQRRIRERESKRS